MRPPRRQGLPLVERLRRSCEVDDAGCWQWLLYRMPNGYGQLGIGGRMVLAHRAAYEAFVGPIPDGLTVDHLCFQRGCVNPEHLRLLTVHENCVNQRRAFTTECPKGHPLSGPNLLAFPSGGRRCRTCRNATRRRRTAQLRSTA